MALPSKEEIVGDVFVERGKFRPICGLPPKISVCVAFGLSLTSAIRLSHLTGIRKGRNHLLPFQAASNLSRMIYRSFGGKVAHRSTSSLPGSSAAVLRRFGHCRKGILYTPRFLQRRSRKSRICPVECGMVQHDSDRSDRSSRQEGINNGYA